MQKNGDKQMHLGKIGYLLIDFMNENRGEGNSIQKQRESGFFQNQLTTFW
jgi:hypothetical protein